MTDLKTCTLKCVRCMKRDAVSVCGHVTSGQKHILAGWCNHCFRASQRGQYQGWAGHYDPRMK